MGLYGPETHMSTTRGEFGVILGRVVSSLCHVWYRAPFLIISIFLGPGEAFGFGRSNFKIEQAFTGQGAI